MTKAAAVTSYTRALAEFACSVAADDLPGNARAATRRLILDTLGCTVGGSGVPSSQIVARLKAEAGPAQATVLVSGDRLSLPGAVYVNAHAANALDAEETIRHSGHLAAATVPAALAVAERTGASGAQFTAAVAVGFDVAARIALSLRPLETKPDGQTVISPAAGSSWAAFAATVAAGRLLGLPPESMAHAFGLTVACAPMPIAGRWGVQASPRPMTKYGLYGAIAQAGVEAALMAKAGMDGDTEVLDGDRGFWRMNGSQACDWDALTDGLGSRWLVEETSYKLFPACQWAMPALELLYRMADEDEVVLADILDLDDARLRELIQPLQEEVKEQGLWAAFLPPHLGGSGWGQVKMALLSEVLGEALWAPTVFGTRAPDSGNAELLAIGATQEQRDRYLQPLLDGEIRSCFAMTEPDAGSDPTRIRTTAQADGDGWLINGHKWFASNASVAAFLLVMCVTDPDAAPREGQSIFLVPRGTPGLTVIRNIPALDDHNPYFRAPQPDQHAEVLLEDVRVTRENLVGGLGQGWELAQARLGPGRIHHCMRWLGQANRAFRMLCERAVSRETAGSRLADKQLIQHYVAQSAAQMQAARLMTLHAAWVIDTGGIEAARTDISMIKFFGSRVLHDVIDRALQVHGSLGYSADMPLEWMYRLARAARIYDGPDEIHEALVARRLLKQFTPVPVPSEHIPTRRLAAERRLGTTSLMEPA